MSEIYCKDVINKAISQIGYQGQSKSSKYSKELDAVNYYNTKKNGACTWCAIFYDWCVWSSVKPSTDTNFARKTVCEPNTGNAGAGCTQKAAYYKSKGRWISTCKEMLRGDQVFFKKSNGSIYHTGIVVDYDAHHFYTVEGSTNGAQVARKTYSYNDSRIAGFGRAFWTGDSAPVSSGSTAADQEELYKKLAKDCIRGKYGNGLTRKQKINSLGYGPIYSKVQKYVNMYLAGTIQ